jgi:hypothetical protein
VKLLATNGREYSIQPLNYVTTNDQQERKSSGHKLARQILKELYPCEVILEEVPIKVAGTTLYADFLLRGPAIVVEVQGKQHGEFVEFFHKTQKGFIKSKGRDRQKVEWCKLNGFELIEVGPEKDDRQWRERLCR